MTWTPIMSIVQRPIPLLECIKMFGCPYTLSHNLGPVGNGGNTHCLFCIFSTSLVFIRRMLFSLSSSFICSAKCFACIYTYLTAVTLIRRGFDAMTSCNSANTTSGRLFIDLWASSKPVRILICNWCFMCSYSISAENEWKSVCPYESQSGHCHQCSARISVRRYQHIQIFRILYIQSCFFNIHWLSSRWL